MFGTVGQVQIDQGLVGNACLFSKSLEVSYRIRVEIDGDLLFQLLCIRILSRVQIRDGILFPQFVAQHSALLPVGDIKARFRFRRFSCRDDANDLIGSAIAVTDNHNYNIIMSAECQDTDTLITVEEGCLSILQGYDYSTFQKDALFFIQYS